MEALVKMCPLNNVTNADVAAGCIAGIYMNFCAAPKNTASLTDCHHAYNQVFSNSFFKPLGDVCPAWRSGPYSAQCLRAVSTFTYSYRVGVNQVTGEIIYMKLTSTHASQLVRNVFGSPVFAPCTTPSTCNWEM
jgi:hypothetical protein